MKKPKIALVGAGNIGGTLAHLALQRNLGDVVLLDVADGIPQGKSLDLNQASAVDGVDALCQGGNDYTLMAGSDVVIVTAGVARKPGMSRDDLLSINAKVMRDVGAHIKIQCPNAFVIVVTNPLDVMVGIMQEATGFLPSKVVGMAGVLDAGRFKHFLSDAMNIGVSDIQSFVLGGHGDSMVPLPRFTSVAGIPLTELVAMGWISNEVLTAIIDRTRNGGGEIVNLLKTGSAYYAPATSAILMAESYLFDQRKIIPCACHLNGEYGVNGLYVGVTAIIGKNGVEKIIELNLNNEEKELFKASVAGVQKLVDDVKDLGL
jgi:malate dehydrogenase